MPGSLFAPALLAAAWIAPAIADPSVIYCGQLLDVAAGEMRGGQTLVIRAGRIESITAGRTGQQGIIDLSDHTCLPGLMDMHTHLSSQLSPASYVERFTLGAPEVALRGAQYARITLEAGFTTVRDLGDSFNASIALREAINQQRVPGPRIYTAAKSLATTGGHADPTNAFRPDLADPPGPADGVVDSAESARQAVRQRYKDGADVIKITATGGVLSVARSGHNPQFMEDEIRAVVETARDYNMHVAAHAHGAEGMKRAIRAGVHSIEHGTMMDEEVIALMIERGTWYVPTISAGRFVADMAEIDGYFPALVRPKAREIGPLIQDTFGRAWRAGVRFAFGTDCGVCPHGDNAREFSYMVETGLPPLEAIRAATLYSAELLDIADELGRLDSGYRADIIAVAGNPLENIATLEDVRFVMKDGQVYKHDVPAQ